MAPFLLQEVVVNACEKFIEWSGFLAEVFYELAVIVAESKKTMDFCNIPGLWPVPYLPNFSGVGFDSPLGHNVPQIFYPLPEELTF